MTLASHCLHMLVSYIASGESIDTCASNLKSTLVIAEVMARYLLTKEKLKKNLKLIALEDHKWVQA